MNLRYFTPVAVACLAFGLNACGRAKGTSTPKDVAWTEPDPSKIPATPEGDSIRAGRLIFNQTPKYAASFVGGKLSCSD